MHRLLILSPILALLLGSPTVIQAEDAAAKPEKAGKAGAVKFLRAVRDKSNTVTALETAIVHYVPKDKPDGGPTIDLIGAVHVGDKAYYERLNKAFEQYDVLLYELVAPEGTRVEKGRSGSGHPVSGIQNAMKAILELEHQLAWIDYQKRNFVHADMSPDEFSKSMAARGESVWSMVFRLLGVGLARQKPGQSVEGELMLAMFDKNRALLFKRILAQQFEELEDLTAAFEGPEGSTIITERNKKALDVMSKQIKSGRKRIGIFYGAGHLADMEKRLQDDFGMKRAGERWLVAWDLSAKAKSSKAP